MEQSANPSLHRQSRVRPTVAGLPPGGILAAIASMLVVACGSGRVAPNEEAVPTSQMSAASETTTGGPTLDPNSSPRLADAASDVCAAAAIPAFKPELHLVFLIDRSRSMIRGGTWDACVDAIGRFAKDPMSAGMAASLTFFPKGSSSCSVADYAKPELGMAKLPSGAIQNKLQDTDNQGETPTEPAIEGALQYAKKLATGASNNAKVAVVLVTDGEPNDCGSNIEGVAKKVKAMAGAIPTYVVGLGNIKGLKEVAMAGGTGAPFVIQLADPLQTSGQLQTALQSLRQSAVACDIALPSAQASGSPLDLGKVNVQKVAPSGAITTIPQNATCTSAGGWRFDDAASPRRIELCPSTCEILGSAPGKVEVTVGCKTEVTVK